MVKSYYAVVRAEDGYLMDDVRETHTSRFDNALDALKFGLHISDASKKDGLKNISIRIVESERDPEIMRHCGYTQMVEVGKKCPDCGQTVTVTEAEPIYLEVGIKCQGCGQIVMVTRTNRGAYVDVCKKCPDCGQTVKVPEPYPITIYDVLR